MAFRQCSSKTLVTRTDIIDKGELFAVWILLSSLERALESSTGVLESPRQGLGAFTNVLELVQAICKLVLLWSERYRLLFGGSGYLIRYRPLIAILSRSLRRLAASHPSEHVEAVLALLQAEPSNHGFQWYGCSVPVPGEGDFIAGITRLGRDAVPVDPKFAELLRQRPWARYMVWDLLKERRGLGELLEHRLPCFTEVRNKVYLLHQQAQQVVQSLTGTEAAGTHNMIWLLEERRFFEEALGDLERNEFGLEPGQVYDVDGMDVVKAKSNNLMRVFLRVAKRLGAEHADHLDVFWQ